MKRCKYILSTLLACCMVIALFPSPALATATSGKCGPDVTWTFEADTGILRLEGTGATTSYSGSYPEKKIGWYNYKSQITAVYVGEGITSLGSSYFRNCKSLSYVKLPSTLQKIANSDVFANCVSLKTIDLPTGLQFIGGQAFLGTKFESIVVPATVTEVRGKAFGSNQTIIFCGDAPKLAYLTQGGYQMMDSYPFLNSSDITVYYPSNASGWDEVINASYFDKVNFVAMDSGTVPGGTQNPLPCSKHTYTSAGGDYCIVCGEKFEPKIISMNTTMYAAKNSTPIRNHYYANNSQIVSRAAKDEPLEITGALVNSVENLWFLLSDGNFVYSKNVTSSEPPERVVIFSANGKDVTNFPEPSGLLTGGSVYTIPTTIPSAKGYIFLGYSTDKNASTAEYKPGQKIRMSTNYTLYALWAERTNTYSEDVSALINKIIRGESDISKLGDNGTRYWTWWYNKKSARTDSWCAVYASYILSHAGADIFSHDAQINPNNLISSLNEKACYHEEDGYQPKTGDLVFFEYSGGNHWNGKLSAAGNSDHVAIVVVEEDGSLHFLHGNLGSRVQYVDDTVSLLRGGVVCGRYTDYIMGYGDVEAYIEKTAN